MKIRANITNSTICVVAAAVYGLVVGFAYGEFFATDKGFKISEWQPLTGAMIALAAALLAYLGVRGTQRVNIMLREEEKIEERLPGLQQTNDFLSLLLKHVGSLDRGIRYLSRQVIRDIVRPGDRETFEDIVARLLPLADPELKRDITSVVFRLMTQADMLTVMKEELDRALERVGSIEDFAPDHRQRVLDEAERIRRASEIEDGKFLSIVETLRETNSTLEERIANAKERRDLIRKEVGQYFRQW